VDHVDKVEHTLAREALRFFRISNGIEIVSVADIPAGTGWVFEPLFGGAVEWPARADAAAGQSATIGRGGVLHRAGNLAKAHCKQDHSWRLTEG